MNSSVLNRPESQAQSRDNLKQEFSSTLDDAEELVRMTADQAGEKVSAARRRVTESLTHARDELQRMQSQATDSARRAAYDVDDYVHTNPWKTMAFAAIVGAVVGLLISHRNHD